MCPQNAPEFQQRFRQTRLLAAGDANASSFTRLSSQRLFYGTAALIEALLLHQRSGRSGGREGAANAATAPQISHSEGGAHNNATQAR